jgi:hypothetical protein
LCKRFLFFLISFALSEKGLGHGANIRRSKETECGGTPRTKCKTARVDEEIGELGGENSCA